MIVFGTRSTHIKTEKINNVSCDYCNIAGSTNISVFGKYAHIFWIPFFPVGKTGVSECNHCKKTLRPSEMRNTVKAKYLNIKSDSKTPIWYWSGIILFLLLFSPTILHLIFS